MSQEEEVEVIAAVEEQVEEQEGEQGILLDEDEAEAVSAEEAPAEEAIAEEVLAEEVEAEIVQSTSDSAADQEEPAEVEAVLEEEAAKLEAVSEDEAAEQEAAAVTEIEPEAIQAD